MTNQQLIKTKIDLHCGKEAILNKLHIIYNRTINNEKALAEIMIIYFGCFYEIDINIDEDITVYNYIARRCHALLLKHANETECQVLFFAANIINEHIIRNSNIKRIS